MALSKILGEAKLTADEMATSAKVTLEQVDGGYAITAVHPARSGPRSRAPTRRRSRNSLAWPRRGCPVSKLFRAEITLDATLVS